MENGKAPNDIRMVITLGLFFICIVGGGVFLALYVLVPTSPPWYAMAGMVLVGIPWIVWLIAYLYSCIKIYRNARELENNVGRVFPKANMSQRLSSSSLSSPGENSPSGNDRRVQFGGVVFLDEKNESRENVDGDADEVRENVNKGRESEIPLKSSASS